MKITVSDIPPASNAVAVTCCETALAVSLGLAPITMSVAVGPEATLITSSLDQIAKDAENCQRVSGIHRMTEAIYSLPRRYSTANWDGYDAEPVSGEACRQALKLISDFPKSFSEADIAPDTEGNVVLEWIVSNEERASLTVTAKGSVISVVCHSRSEADTKIFRLNEVDGIVRMVAEIANA